MKKIIKPLSAMTLAAILTITGSSWAADDHGHDDASAEHDHHDSDAAHDDHDSAKDKMFLVKKEIDGYNVSFHVMKAKPGKEMGGSHDVMIKVEKEGKALTNIVMNTKVKHPDGSSETKKTMTMGEWQMAGYDLGHAGRHQLMVLFKTTDGKKHQGGIYYP